MPSTRRLKLLAVAVVTILVVVLYYSSDNRTKAQRERYMETLLQYSEKDKANQEAAAQMQARLKEAEGAAKEKANSKSPGPPGGKVIVGQGDSQFKGGDGELTGKEKQEKEDKEESLLSGGTEKEKKKEGGESDTMDELLSTILRRSPIIIFSKSYCPFSMKAKKILLDKYDITPAPHVVELDQHPQGRELQEFLGKETGRRTVPNVMVNGKSIGGGDDIAKLDSTDGLASLLKNMGGKRLSVEKKS